MKELFKKLWLLFYTCTKVVTVIFLFLLIGALLSGSFSGDLIPIF